MRYVFTVTLSFLMALSAHAQSREECYARVKSRVTTLAGWRVVSELCRANLAPSKREECLDRVTGTGTTVARAAIIVAECTGDPTVVDRAAPRRQHAIDPRTGQVLPVF